MLIGKLKWFDRWFVPMMRKSQVVLFSIQRAVLCSGIWTAACVAVPLWHQMGGKRQVLSSHTACQYDFTSTHFYRIILRFTETHAEKKISSETVFHWQWRSPRTTAHLIKLMKKTVWPWRKQCWKVQSHMTVKEVKPYVTLQSFSALVSEIEMLLDDAL